MAGYNVVNLSKRELIMAATDRVGRALKDRPEYKTKLKPLTYPETATVQDAVSGMTEKKFGSVIVTDDENRVIGVVTERDIMHKIVGAKRDASTTQLSEIMTREVRLARETDDVLDWLRIMSNERFRRLPVVDADGHILCVFTQGDFVSYTWPDLIYQAKELAKAGVARSYPIWLIGGGIMLYSLLMVIVVALVSGG